jgi:hypothetical protein
MTRMQLLTEGSIVASGVRVTVLLLSCLIVLALLALFSLSHFIHNCHCQKSSKPVAGITSLLLMDGGNKDCFSISGTRLSMSMSFLDNEQLVQKINFMFDFPAAVLLADRGCLWPQAFPADRKLVEVLCITSPYRWR